MPCASARVGLQGVQSRFLRMNPSQTPQASFVVVVRAGFGARYVRGCADFCGTQSNGHTIFKPKWHMTLME